jgi:hypothetical protein
VPGSLSTLEARRGELLRSIVHLNDMRPGSIAGAVWRCGKPTCHCAQPGGPGHGPSLRLIYKRRGKTVTEALPTPAAVRKAEQEVAEFRNYQQLSRELVDVSEQFAVCAPSRKLRPQRKENGRSDPSGSLARSRPTAAGHFHRPAQDRPDGSGSDRDGGAFGHVSRRRGSTDRAPAISRAAGRPPRRGLRLRPPRSLPRTAYQAASHGGRPSRGLAPLLLMRALSHGPVPRRCRTGH